MSAAASPTTVVASPTVDGSANVEPVQITPAADQASGSTPASPPPSLCLLIIAVVLLIAGAILLFGRRKENVK
jgi:hypothetical protein